MNTTLKHTLSAGLLAGVSLVAMSGQAHAAKVIFGSAELRNQDIASGRAVVVTDGVTQVQLDNGAIVSFVGTAEFTIRDGGSIGLKSGTVTITSPSGAPVSVYMPDGIEGRLSGALGAASFTAGANGSFGHVMSGAAEIVGKNGTRNFADGQFWRANAHGIADRVANAQAPAATPRVTAGQLQKLIQLRESGKNLPNLRGDPSQIAQSGLPIALGEALAANGATGDVIAAARVIEASLRNPRVGSVPTGSYAVLIAYAARLSQPYGGNAFPGAGADIVRTYLQYLANGGTQAAFLQVYAGLMAQYLDLLRAGALPSNLQGATPQQINDFLAYQARVGALSGLSAQNKALVDAYLAFLRTGGNADGFLQSYTDLVDAYFDYLRTGGVPAQFQGAAQATINAYLAFLKDANLTGQLSTANRALLDAYLAGLANGGAGLAFAEQYKAALDAYFDYLKAGNLPSAYTGLGAAALRQYLETLASTGLLDRVLGAQADFYRAYLDHLKAGGALDAYAGLPANIFAGYASALQAYFDYLNTGAPPTAYSALTQQQIAAYLSALQSSGALAHFLGQLTDFYAGYAEYLASGGNPDLYLGLPVPPDPAALQSAAAAYATYLRNGGLPAAYGALNAATLRSMLQALRTLGLLNDSLLSDYLDHVSNGGAPNGFAGLPVYTGYAAALQAYYDYLAAGGLPSAYSALTAGQVRDYITALSNAGVLNSLLASRAAFLSAYLTHIQNGGTPDRFNALPVFDTYATAVQAYLTYVANGGLPSAYGPLTQQQLLGYLQALQDAGLLAGVIGNAADGTAYAAYLLGGGVADRYTGLPVLQAYLSAARTYYAYFMGGGRPSQYSALTQQQIVAYIRALDAAGLLAGLADAEKNALRDYATHVGGGGNPDQFAGLPNPNPNPNPGSPSTDYQYAGGFTPSSSHTYKAVMGSGNNPNVQETWYNATALAVDAQGRVTKLSNSQAASNTTVITDVGGDATLLVGRWETPGANNTKAMAHYYAAAPVGVAIPTYGRIDYSILAATKPTFLSGTGTPGTFDADLSIDFMRMRAGLEGTIVMDEGGTSVSYAIATTGGTASPGANMNVFRSWDLDFTAAMTGSGLACTSNCSVKFDGGFGGDAGEHVGFVYYTGGGTETITGAVAFTGTRPGTTNPLAAPNYGYTAGLPTTGLRNLSTWVQPSGSSNGDLKSQGAKGSATIDANGGMQSFTVANTEFNVSNLTRGQATQTDVAGNTKMTVGRWTDGQFGVFFQGNTPVSLSPTQGLHYVTGIAPNFTTPYGGRIDYTLLAATRPTYLMGNSLPGVFDGTLSIAFGSTVKAGIAGTIRMPESQGIATYSFTTLGGTANPGATISISNDKTFGINNVALNGTGYACTAPTCSINFNAAFLGDVLGAGMTYSTSGGGVIQGAAAFTGAWNGPDRSVFNVADRNIFATTLGNSTMNPTSGSYDIDGTGAVVGLNPNGLFDRIGTAQVAESGQLAGNLIGWTRWTNGTLDIQRNGFVPPITLGANTSYQIMHGERLTNMPTSGTASYTLTDGTQVADGMGAIAAGAKATGSALVAFGSTPKVAFDINVNFNGAAYNLFTTGRLADVSQSELSIGNDGKFNGFGAMGTATGGTCNANNCRALWNGFLAGNGAAGIGLHYRLQQQGGGMDFHGIGAFTKN